MQLVVSTPRILGDQHTSLPFVGSPRAPATGNSVMEQCSNCIRTEYKKSLSDASARYQAQGSRRLRAWSDAQRYTSTCMHLNHESSWLLVRGLSTILSPFKQMPISLTSRALGIFASEMIESRTLRRGGFASTSYCTINWTQPRVHPVMLVAATTSNIVSCL